MIEFLSAWIYACWTILCESAPYLLLGFLIAGLIKALVPDDKILKHLGGNDLRSVVIASAIGAPMPLCSCSVLPTAAQLRKGGASKGATTAFLISTPETGVDQLAVTWSLIDPMMAFLRPIAGVVTATTAGVIINLFVKLGWDVRNGQDTLQDPNSALPEADACCATTPVAPAHAHDHGHDHGVAAGHAHDHDHAHDHPHDHAHAPSALGATPRRPRTVVGVLREATQYALGPMLDDLSRWFILGFLVSGLITVLVPPNYFGEVIPNGFVAMLLMLVVATPMYVCATGSTPVAAALIAKGLNPGAALVLLLAGPATSMATIFVVRRLLGLRSTVVYVITIAVFALGFGLLADNLYAWFDRDPRALVEDFSSAPSPIAQAFAVLLSALLLLSARRTRFVAWIGDALKSASAPFGFDPTGRVGKTVGVLALLGVWLSTGYSAVNPGETGFVLRSGKVVDTRTEPGVVLHLPYPFSKVVTVRTDEVRSVVFGAESTNYGENFDLFADVEGLNKSNEDELVTGEENLLRISFAVHYRVRDPRIWAFGLAEPERLLRGFAESSLRRYIGHTRSDESLIASREVMEAEILAILARDLDAMHTGIEAVAVHILELHAPSAVHYQYRDVASALEYRTYRAMRGRGYATERLARARGESASIETEAHAKAAQVLGKARGEGSAYANINAAFQSHAPLTKLRLELEALGRALKKSTLVVLLGDRVTVDLWKGRPGSNASPIGASNAPRLPELPQEDED
jgi:uncharacterized membrane protein YraQ (UPF0718 family)/regulator of protease activity HflC (stomatin/prohibitin superfamily)